MSWFLVAYEIFVLILIVAFVAYMLHALAVSRKGKYPPFVPAVGQGRDIVIENVSQLLEKSSKPLTVLDPGCGTGSLLLPMARKFPQHRFIGIEWAWPYYFCKLFSTGLKNAEFVHGDMFKQDFSEADIVVCFVVKQFTPVLSEKIRKDVRKPCTVFSIYEEMSGMKLERKIPYKHYGVVESSINVYRLNRNP